MTTGTQEYTEETIELAGAHIQLVKGGTGDPMLVLHGELGHRGWLNYHRKLAESNTLYIPSHPGYGESDWLEWIMNMRDMAGWYLTALDELDLGPIPVMGFGIGGWLAAEMATMSPDSFSKLILVGAAGVRPPTGEIFDMYLVTASEFAELCVLNPDAVSEFEQVSPKEPSAEFIELWEVAREQSCRLSWKPYMHYRALPNLLARLKRLSTLIVWGREDEYIPLSAGEQYHESIAGSQLSIIDDCGHQPEIEKTDEFVSIVQNFLSA